MRPLVCALVVVLSAGSAAGGDGASVSVEADPQGATGLIKASITIPAPPRRVWEVMLDCNRSLHIVKHLKQCRILERSADERFDVREHVVQWIWPFPEVRSVFRSHYEPYRHITFNRVAGELVFLEGEWTLDSIDGGAATHLAYRARVTPGWPLPGPLVRSAIDGDLRNTLAALSREAAGQ